MKKASHSGAFLNFLIDIKDKMWYYNKCALVLTYCECDAQR